VKRTLALLVAPVAALSLVAPAQATAPAAKVASKNLLGTGTVTQAFGGSFQRSVSSSKVVRIPTSCTKSKTIKARSGKSAAFVNTSDTGAASVVSAGVAEMKTAGAAKKVVAGQARYPKVCSSYKVAGLTFKVKKFKAPKVGNQAAAYSVSANGVTTDVFTVRKKKKVVALTVGYTGAVQRAKAVKLLKKAVKKA